MIKSTRRYQTLDIQPIIKNALSAYITQATMTGYSCGMMISLQTKTNHKGILASFTLPNKLMKQNRTLKSCLVPLLPLDNYHQVNPGVGSRKIVYSCVRITKNTKTLYQHPGTQNDQFEDIPQAALTGYSCAVTIQFQNQQSTTEFLPPSR